MAWVRVDDHFDEHPKFQMVGPLGWAMWLAGLAYCNRNLTDGFIPIAKVASLVNWKFYERDSKGLKEWTTGVTSGYSGDDVDWQFVANRLVDCGLWEPTDGGYTVHDYLDYQPSREGVMAERTRGKERAQRHREARNAGITPLVTVAPTPTPIPIQIQKTKDLSIVPMDGSVAVAEQAALALNGTSRGAKREALAERDPLPPGELTSDEVFSAVFWPEYPRKVARRAAEAAWKRLRLRDTDEETMVAIMAGLRRDIRGDWKGREQDKIPHASTWINQRRWEG